MGDLVPIGKHKEFARQTKQSAAGALRDSRAMNPTEIFIIGVKPDGDIFVKGAPPDPANALWLMEMAKLILTGQKR